MRVYAREHRLFGRVTFRRLMCDNVRTRAVTLAILSWRCLSLKGAPKGHNKGLTGGRGRG